MATGKDQEGLGKNPEYKELKKEKHKRSDNIDLDLLELFLAFWKERRIIYITLGIFAVVGMIIAFTAEDEYTSEVKLLPEKRQQQSRSSRIASQFGLGNFQATQQEGISIQHYPDIAKSILFVKPILDHKVYVNEMNDSLTIEKYFSEYHSNFNLFSEAGSIISKYTIGLPFTIQSWFKGGTGEEPESTNSEDRGEVISTQEISDLGLNDPGLSQEEELTINLTRSEYQAINAFRKRIEIVREGGIITVSLKMPDPVMAAELTDKVTRSLIDYIKEYRTEKARKDMEFTRERYREARASFRRAQERLAKFRDEHSGQLTQMARTQEELLQSEYDVAFNVYNNLAERLEQARLNLQKETPVVKVLEPAMIPEKPSGPTDEILLVIYLALGFIIGNIIIFGKLVRRNMKEKFKKLNKQSTD